MLVSAGAALAQNSDTAASGAKDSQQSVPSVVREVAGVRPDAAATLELGRRYTQYFSQGQLEPLWSKFAPKLQTVVGGRTGLDAFHLRLREESGFETQVLDERVVPWLNANIYSRTARYSRAKTPVWTRWTLGKDESVLGFLVTPAQDPAPSDRLDYTDHATLRLPFTGNWFVYWGGRSVLENDHAVDPQQRFAYDLLIARDGTTHRGAGKQNADYFCYGRPILAPAAGTVIAAVDGIQGNRPGLLNEAQPLGNHVILEVGPQEFAFLAHLHQGTVAVSRGEHVRAGQLLGKCGNSGRSSQPHLHFHLQTSAEPGAGVGLPAQFHDLLVNGTPLSSVELTRGMVVTAREAKP